MILNDSSLQEKQIAELQQTVKSLEICLTSLTVVLAKKGVIDPDEWRNQNYKIYEVTK